MYNRVFNISSKISKSATFNSVLKNKMGSLERSKKRIHLWKKATIHFTLCFIMGFFTGFAPTTKPSNLSTHINNPNQNLTSHQPSLQIPSIPSQNLQTQQKPPEIQTSESGLVPRRLIILVTPLISTENGYENVLLKKLSNTVKLVPSPILWIVVEKEIEGSEVSETLRKTGIMYRHLVFKESFADSETELNHQRNIALRHIEQHKLSGVVHFAGVENVYDLDFFDEIRDIEVFGTWPMAFLSANRKRVMIEGPVCESSQVIGWHLKENMKNESGEGTSVPIHISSFAFNSSILWDPERWGRTSGTKQDSIKYVKQVVLEDETKLKGIPSKDCSKIMLWRLHFHAGIAPISQ